MLHSWLTIAAIAYLVLYIGCAWLKLLAPDWYAKTTRRLAQEKEAPAAGGLEVLDPEPQPPCEEQKSA